ncbi:MAG: SUMF1/EgtB/PvdO family nonheme iron enzyme [Planctomycetota bacterium]
MRLRPACAERWNLAIAAASLLPFSLVLAGLSARAAWAQETSAGNATESSPEGFADAAELAPRFGLRPTPATRLDPATGEEIAITSYVASSDGAEMVFVPGGPFPMGSEYAEIWDGSLVAGSFARESSSEAYVASEMPKHEVVLSPFFIDRCEVSNAQYERFLDWWEKSGRSREFSHPDEPLDFDHTPWQWKNGSFFDADRPVVGVSWLSAYKYARWAGKRLPTEAEWEKAARGRDSRRFPWGNDYDPRVCNTSDSCNLRTLPVRSLPGGQSPFGCYHMCGNAWEYVLDWHNRDFYRKSPARDPLFAPTSVEKMDKVVRGGCWNKYTHLHMGRVTARASQHLWQSYNLHYTVDPRDYLVTGFRCVVSPVDQVPPPQEPESWKRVFRNHPGARHADGVTVVPDNPVYKKAETPDPKEPEDG